MSTVFVPGRANLIGEHTDYNEGFALPFAISQGVSVHYEDSSVPYVEINAGDFGSWRSDQQATEQWSRQFAAVLECSKVTSGRFSVRSNLPVGAGLSSSAAYLGALALSMGRDGSLVDVARFVQDCERRAGNDVGLLDQFATLGALERHALFIDFQSLEYRDVAIPSTLAFTAVHSGIDRFLSDTKYAERRRECELARAILGDWRSAHLDDLKRIDDRVVRARARHVLSENLRVLDVVSALERGDDHAVGVAVRQSHESLRDHFEVSLPEIDQLVDSLCSMTGVLGARLVGGGFGGCVLVVHEHDVDIRLEGFRSWPLEASNGAFARIGRER